MSPSAPGNCKQCSRSYVYDDCDPTSFCFHARHHFTSILSINNVFEKDLLFARSEVRRIDLDLLYLPKDILIG